MSSILFGCVSQCNDDPPKPVEWSQRIRLSIFLVYSECVGLPALVWAFRTLHRHQKNEGKTLFFVYLLLYNDFIELLLNLFIIPALLQYNIANQIGSVCHILTSFWWASRISGILLQLLVVLERIPGIRHPFCSAVFFPCCVIMVYCFVTEFFFWCKVFISQHMSLVLVLSVTITSWIITCRNPPNKHHSSEPRIRTENQDYTVLAFATLTAALYTISIVLYTLEIWSLWVMCLCLLSLRVITDAPLCVLICRKKHSQTHTDPSTDPAAAQAEQTV